MPIGPITTSHAARDLLHGTPFDAALLPGARNAIVHCLRVVRGERVTLVVEPELGTLAAALLRAVEDTDAIPTVFLVHAGQGENERFTERVAERVAESDASVLLATVHGLPATFRRRMIHAGGPQRRHAHMVGVNEPMMMQGMRADYDEVSLAGQRLIERLASATRLTVTSAAGTDVEVRIDRTRRWHNASGLVTAGGWGNLPGGEVYTTPGSVDGVVCPDGGVWLPDGTELGRSAKLRLVFERGTLARIESKETESADKLLALLDAAENGRRVGQVAFGTNVAVLTPIGALLQDLKMPGFHIALGETYPAETGANWTSPIEIPMLVRRADVLLDGASLMLRGRYTSPA